MSNDFQEDGAWIFLSHSNKDFEQVRRIRNKFEKMGHKPIMFFLKCINDESELDDLIEREIVAREIFFLCKSDNTENAPWVQREIEIINSLENRTIEIIDLNKDWVEQIPIIESFAKKITVFISYASTDEKIALNIANSLKRHDYGVLGFFQADIQEQNLLEQTEKFIKEITGRGFLLLLISPESKRSKFVQGQWMLGVHQRTMNIPIIVKGSEENIPVILKPLRYINFTKGSFDSKMRELIDYMRSIK